MKPSHIIFGGIGTLVETSEYQYQAYNTALMLNDIDYYWERKDYVASLSFSGGPLRLEKIFHKIHQMMFLRYPYR